MPDNAGGSFQKDVRDQFKSVAESIRDLATDVNRLNMNLELRVQAFELKITQLEREDTTLKDLVKTQIALIDQLGKAVDRNDHKLHNMQTFPQTVTSLIKQVNEMDKMIPHRLGERLTEIERAMPDGLTDRISGLETFRISLEGKAWGVSAAVRNAWIAAGAIVAAASMVLHWFFPK